MNLHFSVIIPTYNRAQTIKRAIDSITYQTHPFWELIVVDDGSNDETEKIVRGFHHKQIQYIKNSKNMGVSWSRNHGAKFSNHSWLAFLDSDDEWLPQKLEEQAKRIQADPNIKFVHCDEYWIRNGRRVNPHKKHKKFGGRIFDKCVPLCCVSPSASVVHKDIFKEFGGFNESYPACEDYDLWLKIFSKYDASYIETPLLNKYGGHDDQLSRKFSAMDYWRVRSLYFVLENYSQNLNFEERELTITEITKKAKILMNGYEKHNNFENYDVIKMILDQILK